MLGFGMLSVTCETTDKHRPGNGYFPSIAADSNAIKPAGLAKTLIQDMTED